ncbi:12787_t:CDS:1, partial [Racocetra fulgida]
KHILILEDISLLSAHINNNNTNNQTINVLWLPQSNNSARSLNRINRTPRGATPRTTRTSRTTLSQMGPTTINSNLQATLEANPLSLTVNQTSQSQEIQYQNNLTDQDSA